MAVEVDIADAVEVMASGLPWRRHGPGYLAVLNPQPDGDGTRLLIGKTDGRWWLTIRPLGGQQTVIVGGGTLNEVLRTAKGADR
ncbi:MAG TPA: hypothetical protein VHT75_20355 [Acidimicrobiales bacterium]|jgi:hypothetical protein|nr:hypothetical protein [Acidimicrobiales bacterium]